MRRLLVVAALALGAREAIACPLVCTKTVVDGSEIVGPSSVEYNVAVSCPTSWGEDKLLYLQDSLVGPLFDSNVDPQKLPFVGAGATLNFPYVVSLDYESCRRAPGAELQPDGSVILTNTVTGAALFFFQEDGSNYEFSCSAQVVCRPPLTEGGATRTIGYYKTHAGALAQCLAAGPIDVGFTTVRTVAEANALLWANPGGLKEVDKARATLARQAVGATCNVRLFGTGDGGAVAAAVAALAGRSCAAMNASNSALDAFNNSGDEIAFPDGVGPFENTKKPTAIAPFPRSGLACE